jgi:hypothetical protein
VKATCKEGEDYELLSNMYDELLGQRDRELGHVASMVGGFVQANLWFGDAERRFEPMPSERQREAVQFLHQHAFQTPRSLIDEDILMRLEASGAPERILRGQQRLLSSLLSQSRIDRMAEQADRAPGEAYMPVDLVKDLSKGLWSELESSPVNVDLYRRNLQRAHVDVLAERLQSGPDENPSPTSDLPALARGELSLLLDAITAALSGPVEETTRLHLADVQARIREHLNPLLERRLDPGLVVPASAPNPERRQ